MRIPTRVLFPALLLALAGCSQSSPEPPAGQPDDLTGSTWVLREGEGPAGPVLTEDARVTLHFDEAGDQLGGVSACNEYGAQVSIAAGQVEIGGLGGTDMACERPVMEVERRYLEALQAVDRHAIDGDTLELTGTDTRLEFDRQADAPTEALLDTTWQLESVIEGTGGQAAASEATDSAELQLGAGSLRLETSCVGIDAEWVEQGAEFRITSSAYDYADPDASCLHEDPEQQRIAETFDGAFTAELDGDRLTLHGTRSDTALQFRAAD